MVRQSLVKIRFLVANFAPAGGGVYEAVKGLATALAEDHEAEIVTSRARNVTDMTSLQGVKVLALRRVGPQSLAVAAGLSQLLRAQTSDATHLHGLWSYLSFVTCRLPKDLRGRMVISPHGMLNPWPLRHRRVRKKIALWLFERENLAGAGCLHALNEAEYLAFRAGGLKNPVAIIPNGTQLPTEPMLDRGTSDARRRFLFIGRFHEIKGLDTLINALGRVTTDPGTSPIDWQLNLVGWGKQRYVRHLSELVRVNGLSRRVRFVGPLFGDEKIKMFQDSDLCIMSSRSEGLPMMALESWAHGTPVAMTDKCNLPEGYASGAAFHLPSDVEGMADSIAKLLHADTKTLRVAGLKGKQLVSERFIWPKIAGQFHQVYLWLSGGMARPDFVVID